MVQIRNLKFQPLTLHLANSKRSVHLRPRGRTEIEDRDVSAEMRRAADRGFIVLGKADAHRMPVEPSHMAVPRPMAPAIGEKPTDGRPSAGVCSD